MKAAYLVTEVVDLLIQVVGLLLQLAYGFVLSSQSTEELVLTGMQQVFSERAGSFGLFHRTEWTGHCGVAFLFSLH